MPIWAQTGRFNPFLPLVYESIAPVSAPAPRYPRLSPRVQRSPYNRNLRCLRSFLRIRSSLRLLEVAKDSLKYPERACVQTHLEKLERLALTDLSLSVNLRVASLEEVVGLTGPWESIYVRKDVSVSRQT